MQKFSNWNQVPLILNLYQVAQIMGCSYDHAQKIAAHGDLPAFKPGKRRWVVQRDDLRAWLDLQKEARL